MFGRGRTRDATAMSEKLTTPSMARIQSTTATVLADGSVELHFRGWLHVGKKHPFVEFTQRLHTGHEFSPDVEVPVLYDRWDHARVMVNEPALTAQEARIAARLARDEAEAGPRWQIPHACPNCGAVVDQELAAATADPRCPFCHEPLAIQPLN